MKRIWPQFKPLPEEECGVIQEGSLGSLPSKVLLFDKGFCLLEEQKNVSIEKQIKSC